MRRVALLLSVLAVAGCGGGGDDEDPPAATPVPANGGLTVEEALRSDLDEPLLVRGYYVARAHEPARLCSALAESFPPQCGEPSLRIETDELDEDELAGLRRAPDGSVAWTEREVQLIGLVRDGALVIEAPHR